MTDKAFVKKTPDGKVVVVAYFSDTEAHVKIDGEYRVMPIGEWRKLPLLNEGGIIAREG